MVTLPVVHLLRTPVMQSIASIRQRNGFYDPVENDLSWQLKCMAQSLQYSSIITLQWLLKNILLTFAVDVSLVSIGGKAYWAGRATCASIVAACSTTFLPQNLFVFYFILNTCCL